MTNVVAFPTRRRSVVTCALVAIYFDATLCYVVGSNHVEASMYYETPDAEHPSCALKFLTPVRAAPAFDGRTPIEIQVAIVGPIGMFVGSSKVEPKETSPWVAGHLFMLPEIRFQMRARPQ